MPSSTQRRPKDASRHASAAGFPFFSILMLILITLKLCGVIAWSWWWVLAPWWIPAAAFLLFACFCVAMAGLQRFLS